ncbi:MAG: peptidoglycan-binding protein [Pseudomonadota bacterium]
MVSVAQRDRIGHKAIAAELKNDGPMQLGEQGAAVKWAERMLKTAGFDPGPMDKSFTAKTETAIKQFQASVGLEATGAFDKKTFEALKKVETRRREHDQFIGVGQKGGKVLSAEQRLRTLGYDVGKVDGIFDKQTAAAVKAFRADQGNLKDNTSIMGQFARGVLKSQVQGLHHDPYRARVTKEKAAHRRLDAATKEKADAVTADGLKGFGPGAQGRAVKNVQEHLKAAGYNPGVADGKFDARTTAMVKRFQREKGLTADGRVDDKTWAALSKSYLYASKQASPAQALGERSAAVKQTEKALKTLGYKTGKVDGIFDKQTAQAVRAYERKQHLTVDSKVGQGEFNKIQADAKKKAAGGKPYQIARSLLGKNASWVKTHEPLGKYMPDWVPNNVNCASFVTACLQKAGQLKGSQHDNSVQYMMNTLDADPDFKRVSLRDAKPGDVVVFNVNGNSHGHTVLFAGWKNGQPQFIGSNNANADGSQRITQGGSNYPITAIYHCKG